MGSQTDFAQLENWFNPHQVHDLDDLIEYAEAIRNIAGRGAMIISGELNGRDGVRDMLIDSIGAAWSQYEDRDLRGDWRELWTPAGTPAQVADRVLKPIDRAVDRLTKIQVDMARFPMVLRKSLDPVINPRRNRPRPGFNMDGV